MEQETELIMNRIKELGDYTESYWILDAMLESLSIYAPSILETMPT
jgi:hypothetical protein